MAAQFAAGIDKIFKKKLNMSSHNTSNQNTRDFIKKYKFCDSSHPPGKFPAYGKLCYAYNKKNHFISKFSAYMLVKKYMKLKRMHLMNRPTRAIMYSFIETINIQDSVHINQIKNENSDWLITGQ